jgi:hypothetical protein
MSRRVHAPLLGLALVALVISACGGGSSTAGLSTASTGPDAAVDQGPPESPSRHPRPLPGHPKIGSEADPAPGGASHRGDSSGASDPQTGEPNGASRPRSGNSEPPGRRHAPLTRAGARAAGRRASRHAQTARRKLARQAGAAAPFLVETGDNSIPTYGTEASAEELAAAEAGLSGYLSARAAGEWGAACARMSAGVQKQLAALSGEAAGECMAAYAKLAEKIPASARADPLTGQITALRVESPHAFALFYGPGEQQYMMPLEEEGGAWKVTQLEPLPWPLGSTSE